MSLWEGQIGTVEPMERKLTEKDWVFCFDPLLQYHSNVGLQKKNHTEKLLTASVDGHLFWSQHLNSSVTPNSAQQGS